MGARRGEELLGEGRHLEQSDTDDGRLGVTSVPEAIHKSCPQCHDVLESTRERDAGDVLDSVDAEHRRREDGLPQGTVLGRRAANAVHSVVSVVL